MRFWITEKVMAVVAIALGLAFFGSLIAGGEEALAALFGRAKGNHFAYVAVALFAWFGGYLAGGGGSGDGAMSDGSVSLGKRPRMIATGVFVAIFLFANRDAFDRWPDFVDMVARLCASVVVWGFVVLFPWVSIDKAAKGRRTKQE